MMSQNCRKAGLGSPANTALCGVFSAVAVGFFAHVAQQVYTTVPEPYMDEFFHIRQAQKYCHHIFNEWDPKITTPPGLYAIGLATAKSLDFLLQYFPHSLRTIFPAYCDVNSLRASNFIGFLVLHGLISLSSFNNVLCPSITAFPLLSFYYVLFYTDVWAAVLLLGALIVGRGSGCKSVVRAWLSSFLCLCGVLFRQTNIVWSLVVLVCILDRRVKYEWRTARLNFRKQILLFLRQLLVDADLCIPFAFNVAAFAAFLRYNGGIALGDKENHIPGLNGAQILYFLSFSAVFSWPVWFSPGTIRHYFSFISKTPQQLAFYGLQLVLIAAIVHWLTPVHPFLLADNRHYVFYIYRKIINATPYTRYLLAPVYHFCAWIYGYCLYRSVSAAANKLLTAQVSSVVVPVAIAGATVATIVPSPLFEPRYYILPYLFWRLHVTPEWQARSASLFYGRLVMEFVWYLAVNAVVFHVFLSYPFEWESEPGKAQRFMW